MTILIVAEKPNVAKRIAQSLGKAKAKKKGKATYFTLEDNDIIVASAVGHLFTLRQARPIDRYPFFDIKWMSPSDFDPKMKYLEQYINILHEISDGVDEVVNACDYDLEGSVIGYNAIKIACKLDPKNAHRMKFSTLTKDELIRSFENRERHLNFPMVDAGISRHMLDWYWGMNASKALSSSVEKNSGKYIALSAGRVQTPTLFFINEREKIINAFIPSPFWVINLHFRKDNVDIKASYPKRLTEKEVSDRIYSEIKGKDAKVSDISKNISKKTPPIPLDLGLLQSEAWKNFRFLPKRTQEVAQALYEMGLISYPRTSSQKLPPSIDFKKILESLMKNPNYNEGAKDVLATDLRPVQGKKDDPAHPSIYPTGMMPDKLNKDQTRLYDLIVCRFFSVFMDTAVLEKCKLTVKIGKYPFTAEGTKVVSKGWMKYYGKYSNSNPSPLPDFEMEESINVLKHEKLKKMTKPPARYNPASAIKEMENLGIGTKATRANIIDTLYKRGYINGREIKITEVGSTLVTTLEKYCKEIISVQLTKHFEEEMEEIQSSQKSKELVLTEAKEKLRSIFENFRKNEKQIGKELITAIKNSENENLGKCPQCGKDLKIIISKATNKRFIGCTNYPKCKLSYPLPQKGSIKFSEKRCPSCGAPMLQSKRRTMCINLECPDRMAHKR